MASQSCFNLHFSGGQHCWTFLCHKYICIFTFSKPEETLYKNRNKEKNHLCSYFISWDAHSPVTLFTLQWTEKEGRTKIIRSMAPCFSVPSSSSDFRRGQLLWGTHKSKKGYDRIPWPFVSVRMSLSLLASEASLNWNGKHSSLACLHPAHSAVDITHFACFYFETCRTHADVDPPGSYTHGASLWLSVCRWGGGGQQTRALHVSPLCTAHALCPIVFIKHGLKEAGVEGCKTVTAQH